MQLMIFLLVIIGFCIRKKGIVGTEGRKNMVDLCLFVTLPFNIIHSFLMEWDWGMLFSCAIVLLLSIGYNAVSILTSFACYRKEPHDRQKTLRYGTIVSNGGFLGNPIIEGIYGSSGLFYASIFMIPVRIVMWTIGMSVFMKGSEAEKAGGKGGLFKKVMTNPCIVAVYRGDSDGKRDQPSHISGKYNFRDQQLQYPAQYDVSRDDACGDETKRASDKVRCLLYLCPSDRCAGDRVWADSAASGRSASQRYHSDHRSDADTDHRGASVRQAWRG